MLARKGCRTKGARPRAPSLTGRLTRSLLPVPSACETRSGTSVGAETSYENVRSWQMTQVPVPCGSPTDADGSNMCSGNASARRPCVQASSKQLPASNKSQDI